MVLVFAGYRSRNSELREELFREDIPKGVQRERLAHDLAHKV